MEVEYTGRPPARKVEAAAAGSTKTPGAPAEQAPAVGPRPVSFQPPTYAKTLYRLVFVDPADGTPVSITDKRTRFSLGSSVCQTGLSEGEGALHLFSSSRDALLKENRALTSAREMRHMSLAVAKVLAWSAHVLDQPQTCGALKLYSFVQVVSLEAVPETHAAQLGRSPAAGSGPMTSQPDSQPSTCANLHESERPGLERLALESEPNTSVRMARDRGDQEPLGAACIVRKARAAQPLPWAGAAGGAAAAPVPGPSDARDDNTVGTSSGSGASETQAQSRLAQAGGEGAATSSGHGRASASSGAFDSAPGTSAGASSTLTATEGAAAPASGSAFLRRLTPSRSLTDRISSKGRRPSSGSISGGQQWGEDKRLPSTVKLEYSRNTTAQLVRELEEMEQRMRQLRAI